MLKLAQESPKRCVFVQVSTSFAGSDRTGFIEERLYDSGVNWMAQYKKILSSRPRELKDQTPAILGKFTNPYCYSKRMAEELLIQLNTTKLPLVIIRPSIIGTAANEPHPGWTDSLNLLQGVGLMVGLGILRDAPGNGAFMADIVPVDTVAR